jgi:hypothetical protein
MTSYNIRTVVNNASSKSSNKGTKSQNSSFFVRVLSVNLEPNQSLTSIGTITGEKISTNFVNPSNNIFANIKPKNPYIKIFPLVNEIVKVESAPSPNGNTRQLIYDYPISLYGSTSLNINPKPPLSVNLNTISKKSDYTQVENGAYNVINNNSAPPSYTPNVLVPSTFKEKGNIHPLLPFSGDIIYEGRWGQSLRFGSTSKTTGNFQNLWSNSGNDGDPIIILRNGQDPNSSTNGAEPIIENIKKDLSSIYLTSYQKIPFSITNENFYSYSKDSQPTEPALYTLPQIIINSDRIVLNAKNDNVLISGEKSVGLFSNKSINLEARQVCISSNNVKLGNINADQSVILGDLAVEYLKIIVTEISNLATALKSTNLWPGGSPVPDSAMLVVASQAEANLETIKSKLDLIKSNFVKTI